jgi:hypothetical protein
MQELSNTIKRPNLRFMGINKGKEVQAKRICNILNKIITENFPNLSKVLPSQVQEALYEREHNSVISLQV